MASGGGKTSPLLLKSIYTQLSDIFLNYYGSTEAGGVCLLEMNQQSVDSMPLGFGIPNCTVQVVNEAGEVLPFGKEGLLRIRTPYMAHSYFNNPKASEKYFQEGWFYPGDSGKILTGGLVVLSGRSGEMINRGGVKIDPGAIDQFLTNYPGVIDGAGCGVFNSKEFLDVELAAALVIGDGFDIIKFKQTLAQHFDSSRCPTRFFKVKKFPEMRWVK